MDESGEVEQQAAATPIFNVYRRGYDPEQVDRYVADQQRRLDEALHRASESERKLAAAVGQLRELHRRVAVYESDVRNAPPPELDTLGERVQRILQEAWEGAYNLRQDAEREVIELREQAKHDSTALREQAINEADELRQVASLQAAEVLDEATRRALSLRDETERRRQTYLEQVERDREGATSQLTYLYDQREAAVAELTRLQATIQATVEEMMRSPLGRPSPALYEAVEEKPLEAVASQTGSIEHSAGEPDVAAGTAGDLVGEADEAIGPGSDGVVAGDAVAGSDAVAGTPTAGPVPAEDSSSEASDISVGRPRKKTPSSSSSDTSVTALASGHPEATTDSGAGSGGDAESTKESTADAPAAAAMPRPGDSGADEPTLPMERFVLPKDRDAARAATRRGSGAKGEADSMERTVRSGGDETDEASSRSAASPGASPSQVVGPAADTPIQQGKRTDAGNDPAARPPVVRPKHELFDVEKEGWS